MMLLLVALAVLHEHMSVGVFYLLEPARGRNTSKLLETGT